MRIMLTLDDALVAELKRRAHESGRPFEAVVNEAIRSGLEQNGGPLVGQPYSVPAHRLGTPRPGINLDKSLAIAGELEDTELARSI